MKKTPKNLFKTGATSIIKLINKQFKKLLFIKYIFVDIIF